MKKSLYAFIFLSNFIWASNSPIEVRISENKNNHYAMSKVNITSLVDNLEIISVNFNRGNCEVNQREQQLLTEWYSYAKRSCDRRSYSGDSNAVSQCFSDIEKEFERKKSTLLFPISLKYGQSKIYEYGYECNLRELEIQTNLGTWINNQFSPNQADDYDISEYCEECEDDYSLYQSFYIDGRTIDLLKSPAYGMSCPNGQFVFRENGNLTESFGTCSEELHIQQKSNKIVVTMSGYQYVDAGSDKAEIKAAEKVSKQIWQYTYENQKLEEKQLR